MWGIEHTSELGYRTHPDARHPGCGAGEVSNRGDLAADDRQDGPRTEKWRIEQPTRIRELVLSLAKCGLGCGCLGFGGGQFGFRHL